MNWEAVGAIAEVLAALAVLVTLIYLSLQVRQSNLQGRVQIQNSITQHMMPSLRDLMWNPEPAEFLVRLQDPTVRLSETELIRARAYVQHQMYVLLNMYIWSEELKDDRFDQTLRLNVAGFASLSGLVRAMMVQEAEHMPVEFKRIVEESCAADD